MIFLKVWLMHMHNSVCDVYVLHDKSVTVVLLCMDIHSSGLQSLGGAMYIIKVSTMLILASVVGINQVYLNVHRCVHMRKR